MSDPNEFLNPADVYAQTRSSQHARPRCIIIIGAGPAEIARIREAALFTQEDMAKVSLAAASLAMSVSEVIVAIRSVSARYSPGELSAEAVKKITFPINLTPAPRPDKVVAFGKRGFNASRNRIIT